MNFPPDENIDNYVLKTTLFICGHGVDMQPTPRENGALEKSHEMILQKKIDYADIRATVDGQNSKAKSA